LAGHCVHAIEKLAAAGRDPLVLNLGANAPMLPGVRDAIRVLRPGPLPSAELGAWLAAADLALLPFVDGASTRRTTLIAALQQGVCVLSTDGPLTDRELAVGPGPVLIPVRDEVAFADLAATLAADAPQRASSATAGLRLFEQRFDWPVIAERLLASLRPSSER
jgi:glycosyltransferase involved in cell wall biosynthesis